MPKQYGETVHRLPEAQSKELAAYILKHYVGNGQISVVERQERCQDNTKPVDAGARPFAGMAFLGTSAAPPAADVDLDELAARLKNVEEGFSARLLRLIDEAGKKDSEIYNRAMVSRQHFSKIRKDRNYRPTKKTAIALALALELDVATAEDLIGRAGYALTNSSKFDLVIRYCLERRQYNLALINCMLEEYGQPQFGF